MSPRPIKGSGDGTRPSTSGGVDNMGAGESFTGKKTAAGDDVSGPAPHERMQDKRINVESTKHEDSAAFGLTEDLAPETNQEQAGTEPERHSETRQDAIRRAATKPTNAAAVSQVTRRKTGSKPRRKSTVN